MPILGDLAAWFSSHEIKRMSYKNIEKDSLLARSGEMREKKSLT